LVLSQARLAETVHRAVVDDDLAAGHLLALQGLAPGIEWCAAGEVMAEIRGVKTPEELTVMERSAAMADSVYAETVFRLEAGIAERELQSVILDAFRARGASSSWAIVAFGPNSALPHHHSGDRRLQPGDIVVLDLGGCLDGYQSDITRTLAFGFAPPDAAAVYDIVREAHLRVLAVARPGIECQAVDACARAVIESAGYGDRFVHRTGHGIGMSTHEPPNLVAGDATTLRAGMCFSDEPGIYLQGRFGVRIENIIAITEDGARSLNAPAPESLPILEPNSRP
jgi:Xaa-Pro aminopeptidase